MENSNKVNRSAERCVRTDLKIWVNNNTFKSYKGLIYYKPTSYDIERECKYLCRKYKIPDDMCDDIYLDY